MFEPLPKAPSLWSEPRRYFGQLIFSYPLVMFASSPVFWLLSAIGLTGHHGGTIYFVGYKVVACVLAGWIVGWLNGRVKPRLIPTGCWIWVFPVMLAGLEFISDLARSPSFSLPGILLDRGGKDITAHLVTFPASSALGYSIGMLAASGRVSRIAFAAVPGLLVMAVLFAKDFAEARLEIWRKTAFLADPQGVRYSRDPNLLCAGAPVNVLRGGEAVEIIEHRNCGQNRLLGAGAPRQPEEWSLLRVRILDGGAEVWVLDYGVRSRSP